MAQTKPITQDTAAPRPQSPASVVPIDSARTTLVHHVARVRVRRIAGTKHGDTVQVEDVLSAGAPYTLACTADQLHALLPLQWDREFELEAEVRVTAHGRIVRGRLISLLPAEPLDNGEGASAWLDAAAGDHWAKVADINEALRGND